VNIHDIYLRLGRRLRRRTRPGLGDPAVRSPDSDDSGHPITDLFERLVAEAVGRGVDGDRITAALEQATQAAADVLAERLRAGAPRMLREHRELRRGFEERLQQRWGSALDLYECVCVCCLEAGEDFAKRCSQQADGPDPKLAALTLLHARACLVASEVQSLLRSGHAVGAQARWRTLHELAVIAFVLGDHDRDLSERFLQHRQVERHKDALYYQQYCQALGYPPFSDEQMADIQQQRDEVVARYGTLYKNDWGWAVPVLPANQQPNFRALEEAAGLQHFRPWFRLSSHGVHSGATGAIHIRDFYGRGTAMLAGPSNAGLADPGNGALISLHQVTVALLVHGGPNGPQAQDLLTLKAISNLLDQARQTFLEIHQALEAEEAAMAGQS
jgi:Family of unknown function (DUF5677)